MHYEVSIPSTTPSGYPIHILITVQAPNWMSALKIAINEVGENNSDLKKVSCTVSDDGTIHVFRKSSKNVITIKTVDVEPSTPTIDDDEHLVHGLAAAPSAVEPSFNNDFSRHVTVDGIDAFNDFDDSIGEYDESEGQFLIDEVGPPTYLPVPKPTSNDSNTPQNTKSSDPFPQSLHENLDENDDFLDEEFADEIGDSQDFHYREPGRTTNPKLSSKKRSKTQREFTSIAELNANSADNKLANSTNDDDLRSAKVAEKYGEISESAQWAASVAEYQDVQKQPVGREVRTVEKSIKEAAKIAEKEAARIAQERSQAKILPEDAVSDTIVDERIYAEFCAPVKKYDDLEEEIDFVANPPKSPKSPQQNTSQSDSSDLATRLINPSQVTENMDDFDTDNLTEVGGGSELISDLYHAVIEAEDSAENLKEFLETAVSFLGSYIPCEFAAILLPDANGTEYYFTAVDGRGAENIGGIRFPLQDGVVGFCLQKGVPVIVQDPTHDKRHTPRLADYLGYQLSSICCAPLIFEQQIYGALQLVNSCRGGFTADELSGLQLVGERLGKYIHDTVIAFQVE